MAVAPSDFELNLQSSYGVMLIGCFISAAVWGVSFVQTILYFLIYDKDTVKLKFLVLFLITVDTANEILVLKSVWPALILHWGRTDILRKSQGIIELVHHVWVAAIVAAGVQSYYVWRIYTLSGRKRLFPSFLILLVAWQIIGLAPYNFLVFKPSRGVSAGKQTRQLTAVAISLRATGAVTDILIAGAMLYLLLAPRNSHKFASTQKLVSRLLLLSINSGFWTALFATLDFIFILVFPTYFTFSIFELPLCSLYLNTLLTNLNARKFLGALPDSSMMLSDMTPDRHATSNDLEPIHFVQPSATSTRRTSYDYPSHENSRSKEIPFASQEDLDRI